MGYSNTGRLPGSKGLVSIRHLLERLSNCLRGFFRPHPNTTEVHRGAAQARTVYTPELGVGKRSHSPSPSMTCANLSNSFLSIKNWTALKIMHPIFIFPLEKSGRVGNFERHQRRIKRSLPSQSLQYFLQDKDSNTWIHLLSLWERTSCVAQTWYVLRAQEEQNQ